MNDQEKRERILLWCRYYYETEVHDRALPGRWDPHDRDAWLPLPEYRAAMLGFASSTLRRLGLHERDPARHDAARLGFAEWKRIAAQRRIHCGTRTGAGRVCHCQNDE